MIEVRTPTVAHELDVWLFAIEHNSFNDMLEVFAVLFAAFFVGVFVVGDIGVAGI
jgi:hypothetical protein